jgi:hypothetical protein
VVAVVSLPGAQDEERLQRCDPEAALHEQDQLPAALVAPPRQVHGGQGLCSISARFVWGVSILLAFAKKLFALCDMDCVCGTAGESDGCDRGHRDRRQEGPQGAGDECGGAQIHGDGKGPNCERWG